MDVPRFSGDQSTGAHVDTRFLYRLRDAKESIIKPRLLIKSNGDFYNNLGDFQDEPWYKRLTDEQRKNFNAFITTDVDKVDILGNKYYYTIKEVLRKIGANLNTVVENPTEFGERETILAGGYPTNEASLSHIIEAYNKNHNLKIYDIQNGQIFPDYRKTLEQEEILRDIDFNFGKALSTQGPVCNHDILIPHPGPFWIENNLALELNTVLGPGSKAYILTDTAVSQRNQLKDTLQKYSSLQAKEEFMGNGQIGEKIIILGGISIKTVYEGPYYVFEISRK